MRYLIVVARNQPALYEHLRNRHGRDPRVGVVVDRRGAGSVDMTANPPPVERRRRPSWLGTGASHELVELPAEATTASPAPTQKSETPRSEMETLDDPQQVTRWLADSQQMLDRVVPGLIAERDRLRQRLEATERECERLRGELGEIRRNLGAIQGELERLRGERASMAAAFDEVVDLLGQLHRPMDELTRWLQVAQPATAATRSPSVEAAVLRPTRNGGP